MSLRSRITWVIGVALAALRVVAALDALRSKGNRRSVRTSAAAGIVSSTPTEGLGSSPAVREYVLRASAICTKARSDLRHAPFGPVATLEDIAAWDADAARAAESSLRRLQLLPPPPVGQALMEQFFSEAVEEIDLLRQSAAAASAGEETHALEKKRVDAVHRKDAWVISSRRAGG